MTKTDQTTDITPYIKPLNMNGLQGRMLHAPSTTKRNREILLIYGHHALLERWWGLVQNLQNYGSVTMPDLPGFGGMDSFYNIGTKPTIDAYADYLASFVKLRFRKRKITIAGISYGFVVATRMLQKYPELASQVDILVSIVGFAHHDDFVYSATRKRIYRFASRTVSLPLVSGLFRYLVLNRPVIKYAYHKTHNAKHKFRQAKGLGIDMESLIETEVRLWQENDVRTHMYTTADFMRLNNCHTPLHMPVWHVYSDSDHYFNHHIVEQHLRIIFSDVFMVKSETKGHVVPVTASKNDASSLLPRAIRLALAKQSKV